MQKKTLQLFWNYSRPYAKLRWIAIFGAIFSVTVVGYLSPLVIAQLFDFIQKDSFSFEAALPIIVAYTALLILGEVIGWRITLWATWKFETATQVNTFSQVFEKLSTESLSFHSNRFGGSLVSQGSKMVSAIERFWDLVVWQILPSVTSVVAATVILSFVFWQYALFIFLFSFVFVYAVYKGNAFVRERVKEEVQAHTAMSGRLADTVTNISTVKSFGSEYPELTTANAYAQTWRAKSINTMWGVLSTTGIYSSLIVVVKVAAVCLALLAAQHNVVSAAALYIVLTYSLSVARHLWETNNIIRHYNRVMGDAHDMVDILYSPNLVVDNTDKEIVVKSGEIVFEDMDFAHDEGNGVRVFKDFNLVIDAGQRVGLVGHSGSGKTTLTRLLLRFSDIDDGQIKIDGQNIAQVTQKSLRESIAYVPQEPLLFHRSLRENIAYGKPGATDDEILRAAKQAHALEFIDKLPDGLETTVGERGVKLSGGQRQRIAIARAILKDAPILVLDEATSALDSESEKLIQASLDNLMKGRTSIVIAHRLSTIAKLDRIIVLDQGKIVEDGSHKELLTKNGIYASLWSHQSGGFIEE